MTHGTHCNWIICFYSFHNTLVLFRRRQAAAVGGGHSSSNVAAWAYVDSDSGGQDDTTIILDMNNMASVSNGGHRGGGSLFRQLAEVCADACGALPIGTGDTVGVCGYTMNGGLSGYFGKRLGMLGQRVVNMEIILADGAVKNLTPASAGEDGDLFYACLGTGSAMGVVTSLTFKMEAATSFSTGGSIVVACGSKTSAKPFLEKITQFYERICALFTICL
jgi:FAD/FMN-containing dehydrogenase